MIIFFRWSTLLQERDACKNEIQQLRTHLVKTDEQWQDRISKLKIDHEALRTKVNAQTVIVTNDKSIK